MLDARGAPGDPPPACEPATERILDLLPTAVVIHGADSAVRYANSAALAFLGLTEDQVRGRAAQDPRWRFVRPDGSPMPLDEFPVRLALSRRAPLRDYLVGVVVPPAEEPRWGLTSAFPELDAAGAVRQVIVTFVDFSDRMRAEAARAHLAAIIESSNDAIIGKTLDGVIQSWNGGAERMYGYAAAEVIGVTVDVLAPPERAGEGLALVARVRRGEPVVRQETVRVRKDGRRIDVALTLSPIRSSAGEIAGVSTIARDVTERVQLEREVRRHRERLQELVAQRTSELQATNRELEAFAYSISHDLRAPLRHIAGFIELLRRALGSRLDEKTLRYAQAVEDAAGTMGRMVDDLLAFSQMGRTELERTTVDLGSLVVEVVRELAPEAAGRDVAWRVGELPRVHADRGLLRLALANLLANALKFTRPRARAEIEVGQAAGGEGEVVLFVRDNGVGFDPAYVHKLFQVFKRLHRAEEFEGTGIGLANVRRIAERHGGRAWAEGRPDEGATFYLSLPQPPQRGQP